MDNNKHNIFIIAGELSGDMRAAELLKELSASVPDISFWGIGGDNMALQGVELIEHIRSLSIIGVAEAIKKLPSIRKQYNKCVNEIEKRRPAAAILIDYPGFNLRMAEYLHKKGIPVIYYIIPQVWAWGQDRVKKLRKFVDKIIVLFEFEKLFLKKHGISSEFIGHPLVDRFPADIPAEKSPRTLTISLLPGSRVNEINTIFPVMLEASRIIRDSLDKDVRFILAETSNIGPALYDTILRNYSRLKIQRIKDNTRDALAQSDFAVITSGTATLEAALMEKPFILTYKSSLFTSICGYLFIKIPYLGLVNIIAGKTVAPEMLQYNATPDKIAAKVLELLKNGPRMEQIKKDLKKVKKSLGDKGASYRAAQSISNYIKTQIGPGL